jgi:hypothetical protein
MQSKNVGLLVLKNDKVRHINKNFKNYLNTLGIEASYKTLLDINENYNQDFKIYKKYSFLENLLEKYKKFNSNDNEDRTYHTMALSKSNLELFYNGFVHNGEKYNVFTIKPLHKNLKLMNNKFFEVSKKINKISLQTLSNSNFKSYDIFNQIFSILKKELMLDAFIVALENEDYIYINF